MSFFTVRKHLVDLDIFDGGFGGGVEHMRFGSKLTHPSERFDEALQAKYDEITARLQPGITLDAAYADGELCFLVDGVPVIESIFIDAQEGAFILAQWKMLSQTFDITEKTDGKKLCAALRKLADTDNQAVVEQVIALEKDLTAAERQITETETALNALVYTLYKLTADELALVSSKNSS